MIIFELLVNRLFYRAYWFYAKVIKESDGFMVFWYSLFVVAMMTTFNVWALERYLDYLSGYRYRILSYGYEKGIAIGFLILGVWYMYFAKRKEEYIKKSKEYLKRRFEWKDAIVIIYILFSFWFYWKSMEY